MIFAVIVIISRFAAKRGRSGKVSMEEKTIEERIKAIEGRNKRVESDKAWERSPIRIGLVIGITYIFAVGYLWIADTTNPFFGAMVPCLGFLLSMVSLKFVRRLWAKQKKSCETKEQN